MVRDTTFVGILSTINKKDTLNIEASFIDGFCLSFIGEIELINDSIISLNYTDYGEGCLCACCYRMTYKIYTKNKQVNT